MVDCPNCGTQVDEREPVCTNCGFDIHSSKSDAVRKLREEGRIHPGTRGAEGDDWSGGDPDRFEKPRTELPAEDLAWSKPEEVDPGTF